MASNIFMLSYTVNRKEVSSWDADHASYWADNVRSQIPKVKEGWETHVGVETTLTGTMDLNGSYYKVGAAKTVISQEIDPLLKEVPSKYKPDVLCVLLVNGIDEVIKFQL